MRGYKNVLLTIKVNFSEYSNLKDMKNHCTQDETMALICSQLPTQGTIYNIFVIFQTFSFEFVGVAIVSIESIYLMNQI
jgi:hypothetical protein